MVDILIVDDHEIVRRGIKAILETRPEWKVVAEATDGDSALTMAAQTRPSIAIVDYSLPGLNGAPLIGKLRVAVPGLQILVFTMHDTREVISGALLSGARGFLLKSDENQQLLAALDALSAGKTYFASQVNEALLDHYLSAPDKLHLDPLTAREREIARFVAEGRTNKETAALLEISPKTVEVHRTSIMKKLGIATTAELVRYAIRNGLIGA